jgi:hypothetical protein
MFERRTPIQRILLVWLVILPTPVAVTALVGYALGGSKAAGYCALLGLAIGIGSLGFAFLLSRSGRKPSSSG